ncbi:hypothetical protein N7474_009112 [Penicillium riverlandense]|uniref:uncharacterized protein n=1 Tax=Penicillium riverlandense TaxID=1903569 RepID=UPI002547DBC8|nr:uncharacterized protein N7474_009112 [Penicillium riverlandense]KAJ5807843.1 hypothetical protein N7474_009112 [Penicillium riverlandense]
MEELLKDLSSTDDDQGVAAGSMECAALSSPRAGATNIQNERERRISSDQGPETNPRVEETVGLIRDTAGREHFIGPSGSLQFLGQLRRLILISRSEHFVGSPASTQLTATFVEEDAAQALEADGKQNELPERSSRVTGSTNEDRQIDERSPASLGSALVWDFASIPVDDIEKTRKQLPPRHVVDSLVRLYFKDVHPDFPLFHRGTFAEEYETYMSTGRCSQQQTRASMHPSSSTVPEPGWLGCLHMMIAFGSLSSPSDVPPNIDLTSLSQHCVRLTRQLLPHLISRCTLSNIRALLLLSLFLHNHNERNAAWNLVGTAMRLSFAVGLHRASDNRFHFRPMEREVRKRVFCTIYSFEQFLASSLGRPSGFYDFEGVEIVPPCEGVLDGGHDEEDETMKLSLELQIILAKARVSIAVKTLPVGCDERSMDSLARQEQSSRETLEALNQWRNVLASRHVLNIPFIGEAEDLLCQGVQEAPLMSLQELKAMMGWQSRHRLRTGLVLHLQYRYIAVLVTRSSLLLYVASAQRSEEELPAALSRSKRANDQYSGPVRERLSDVCVTHAVQLCRLILLADSFDLVNGISAMDIFYAYCGVMVLILRSLRISISASHCHDQHEAHLQMELRQLIAQTREVLMRVNKCSTMKRFARVVATFEDGSKHDNTDPAVPVADHSRDGRMATAGKNAQVAPGIRTRLTDPVHSTSDGRRASNLAAAPGAGISHDTFSLSASQQDPISLQHEQSTGVMPRLGIPEASWRPNFLTSFDGEPDTSGWMDSLLAPDGTLVVDWGDIESLLARNSGQ